MNVKTRNKLLSVFAVVLALAATLIFAIRSTGKANASGESVGSVEFTTQTSTTYGNLDSGANIAAGDGITLRFDVVDSYIKSEQNIIGIIVWTGAHSEYPYSTGRGFMAYNGYAYVGGTIDAYCENGGDNWYENTFVVPEFSCGDYLAAGRTVKAVFTPNVSGTQKGNLELYSKYIDEDDSAFVLKARVEGVTSSLVNNTDVKIGLFFGGEGNKMKLANQSVTSGGSSYPIIGKYGLNRTSLTVTQTDSVIYNETEDFAAKEQLIRLIGHSDTFGIRDSARKAVMNTGDVIEMEFDITGANIVKGNVGLVISGGQNVDGWKEYPYNDGCMIFNGPDRATEEGAQVYDESGIPSGVVVQYASGFTFADLYSTGRSVKIVYRPYYSENSKGLVTVYAKYTTDAEYGEPVLTVSNLAEHQANKLNAAIGIYSAEGSNSYITVKGFKATYKTLSGVTESLKAGGFNCGAVENVRKSVEKAEMYFGDDASYLVHNQAFNKSEVSTVAFEMDVIDVDYLVMDTWSMFCFGDSLSENYLFNGHGAAVYFKFATHTVNTTVLYSEVTDIADVMSKGRTVKCELDVLRKQMRVYVKDTGDYRYGKPIAVVSIDVEIPNSFYFGYESLRFNYMYAANISYTVNGERMRPDLTHTAKLLYNDVNPVTIDLAVTVSANKQATGEAGRAYYVYEEKTELSKISEIEFEKVSGYDFNLAFSDSYDLSFGAEYITVYGDSRFYKLVFSGTGFDLYTKKAKADAYTASERYNISKTSFFFGIGVENANKTANTIVIDDITIRYKNAGVKTYDFNIGRSYDWQSVTTKRSVVMTVYDYAKVMFYRINGELIGSNLVGIGNSSDIPAGEYVNAAEIAELAAIIYKNTDIIVYTTEDYFMMSKVTVIRGKIGIDSELYVLKGSEITVQPDEWYSPFVGWEIGGEIVSNEAEYKFVVNDDVIITATYKKATIIVVNGKVQGKGTREEIDYTETITVEPLTAVKGYKFARWEENNVTVSEELSYTFTVTGDTVISAVFVPEKYRVTVSGGHIVDGGREFDFGTSVTVVADEPAGKQISGWYIGEALVSEDATYTFEVSGDVDIVAQFKDKQGGGCGGCSCSCGGNVGGNGTIIAAVIACVAVGVILMVKRGKGNEK